MSSGSAAARRGIDQVAAQQGALHGGEVAGALLLEDFLPVEDEHLEAVQARREQAQLLGLVVGGEAVVQPGRAGAGGGVQVVDVEGAEEGAVARGDHVLQLQAGVTVVELGPAGVLACRVGRKTDQSGQQQADEESCGSPEPTHGEVPSVVSGRIIAKCTEGRNPPVHAGTSLAEASDEGRLRPSDQPSPRSRAMAR
jgi:hypothetical protein